MPNSDWNLMLSILLNQNHGTGCHGWTFVHLNICTIAKAVNKKIKASSEWKLSAPPHAIHRFVAAEFPIALGFTAGPGRFFHLCKLGFWLLSKIPAVRTWRVCKFTLVCLQTGVGWFFVTGVGWFFCFLTICQLVVNDDICLLPIEYRKAYEYKG